jgi:hypothetical protein
MGLACPVWDHETVHHVHQRTHMGVVLNPLSRARLQTITLQCSVISVSGKYGSHVP